MKLSRLVSCLILALTIPAGVHAQSVVPGFVPYCVSPSGGPWVPGERCVQPLVAPPTGVPAWLQPRVVAPPAPPPAYVVPVAPSRGLDPWIPLAGRPSAGPSDVINQLLLEALAERRAQRQAALAPAPAPVVPAAAPRRAPEKHWMDAFIKPVNPAP